MSVESALARQCDPHADCSWASNRFTAIDKGPFTMQQADETRRVDGLRVHLWVIRDRHGGFIARGFEGSIRAAFEKLELSYAHWLMTRPDPARYDPLEETQPGDA